MTKTIDEGRAVKALGEFLARVPSRAIIDISAYWHEGTEQQVGDKYDGVSVDVLTLRALLTALSDREEIRKVLEERDSEIETLLSALATIRDAKVHYATTGFPVGFNHDNAYGWASDYADGAIMAHGRRAALSSPSVSSGSES